MGMFMTDEIIPARFSIRLISTKYHCHAYRIARQTDQTTSVRIRRGK